jgi:hypothetical protein
MAHKDMESSGKPTNGLQNGLQPLAFDSRTRIESEAFRLTLHKAICHTTALCFRLGKLQKSWDWTQRH